MGAERVQKRRLARVKQRERKGSPPETERVLKRRLTQVKQRERNEPTSVEFLRRTVLEIWCGLRRLSQTEGVLNRKLARVKRPAAAGKRERNELLPIEYLDCILSRRSRPSWRCINWLGIWVVNVQKLKILMCVLAPVRNFSVVCFEWVRTNSVCGALSIRSGRPLAQFEVTTGSFL